MAAAATASDPVLLGYPDGDITSQYRGLVDFTTNKIGGEPDWIGAGPPDDLRCGLCGSLQSLVAQIYAPVDSLVIYHRTLYILACVQPSCFNHSDSWRCVRGQKLASAALGSTTAASHVPPKVAGSGCSSSTKWCDGSDDWGSGDDDDQANGNMDPVNDNQIAAACERSLANLCLDSHSRSTTSSSICSDSATGDSNANVGGEATHEISSARSSTLYCAGAAGGNDCAGAATAEIEADTDSELEQMVAVETVDFNPSLSAIPELLCPAADNRTFVTPQKSQQSRICGFAPMFLAVDEEDWTSARLTEHEMRLLKEYQLREGLLTATDIYNTEGCQAESYEKAVPKHGDVWFHKFLSAIRRQPDQVIRYCRTLKHDPLFICKPPAELPSRCAHCRGPVSCEVQLLPSLIVSLRPVDSAIVAPEFGTVLIYTCHQACWEIGDSHSGYKNEHILVQPEPM